MPLFCSTNPDAVAAAYLCCLKQQLWLQPPSYLCLSETRSSLNHPFQVKLMLGPLVQDDLDTTFDCEKTVFT